MEKKSSCLSIDKPEDKAVVLLSGGQDSTTCLFWAKNKFKEVTAISFFYEQRHMIELQSARRISFLADVKHEVLQVPVFKQFDDSALITELKDLNIDHRAGNLPASFLPGRNIIFLTLAAMYAYKNNISNIVGGMCEEDYCVSGDTLIDMPRDLEENPEGIPIEELVGEEFLVWSWDIQQQKTVLKRAFDVKKTFDSVDLYEVVYTWGVGKNKRTEKIKTTADHRFLLISGRYVKCKDLSINDRLQPFHVNWDNGYRKITSAPGETEYEHKMVVSQTTGYDITTTKDWRAHHKDFRPKNNHPDNLEKVDFNEHMRLHTKQNWNEGKMHENNLFITDNPMNHQEYREKVSKSKKEFWANMSDEEMKRIKENARNKTLEDMKREGYQNPSKLPGVKFKQKYAAFKRYNNAKGMEAIKKEAEQAGFSINHKVVSVKHVGKGPAYDMKVEDTHNFAANGIFIHNSGYPDCRDSVIQNLQATLRGGLDFQGFTIHTPLMFLTKAESVLLASTFDGCMEAMKFSHTCYEGRFPPCGKCPSCILRAKGFAEAGVKDPVFNR